MTKNVLGVFIFCSLLFFISKLERLKDSVKEEINTDKSFRIGYRMDEVFAERAELTELVELRDNFSNGSLNPKRYGVDPSEKFDYRLRLRVNTIGTKDDTMKFHGVRSVEKVNLRLQIPRHILD